MKTLRYFLITAIIIAPYMTACSHAPKQDRQVAYKSAQKRASAPAQKKKQMKPLIVLDPGHGGFDLGAQTQSHEEKKLALSTSFLVKKYLNDRGYPVMMTRTRDVFIPLKQRAHVANSAKSAIFVSLHFNAAKNNSAQGIEIYYFNNGKNPRCALSKRLAQSILSSMLFRTGASSRGVKPGNFLVIRETNMPAILIEGGFITNQGEGNKLSDTKYREKIALAVADGIEKYFK